MTKVAVILESDGHGVKDSVHAALTLAACHRPDDVSRRNGSRCMRTLRCRQDHHRHRPGGFVPQARSARHRVRGMHQGRRQYGCDRHPFDGRERHAGPDRRGAQCCVRRRLPWHRRGGSFREEKLFCGQSPGVAGRAWRGRPIWASAQRPPSDGKTFPA